MLLNLFWTLLRILVWNTANFNHFSHFFNIWYGITIEAVHVPRIKQSQRCYSFLLVNKKTFILKDDYILQETGKCLSKNKDTTLI